MSTIKKITFITIFGALLCIFFLIYRYHFNIDYQINMIPTEKKNANKMRDNYQQISSRKIKKYIVNEGKYRYPIDTFKSMSPGKADSLQIHFIVLDNNFDFDNHPDLKEYRDKLYLAFDFIKDHRVVNKEYFILDKKGSRVYVNNYINKLKEAYLIKILPLLGRKNNTKLINVDMLELKKYIGEINKSSTLLGAVHPNKVVFELTEEFGSEKQAGTDGQLTVFTNVNSNLGIRTESISSYNANSLCPPCVSNK